MRRRPRIAFKLLVFLLLGAIINVAVAWGLTLHSTPELVVTENAPVEIRVRWKGSPFASHFGKKMASYNHLHGHASGLTFDEAAFTFFGAAPPHPPDAYIDLPNDDVIFGRITSGWPMFAMVGEAWKVTKIDHAERADLLGKIVYRGSIKAPQHSNHWMFLFDTPILPATPLWPGFAINTIFYALLLWALLAVPGYIKRRRRIKRGECVRCAYPLGVTSSVCSECGTPRSAAHGAAAPCNPRSN